jgi:hypothetical protein
MKKNRKKKSFLNTREKVPSKLHYCKGILSIYLKEGTDEDEDKRKLLLICPSGIYGVKKKKARTKRSDTPVHMQLASKVVASPVASEHGTGLWSHCPMTVFSSSFQENYG